MKKPCMMAVLSALSFSLASQAEDAEIPWTFDVSGRPADVKAVAVSAARGVDTAAFVSAVSGSKDIDSVVLSVESSQPVPFSTVPRKFFMIVR